VAFTASHTSVEAGATTIGIRFTSTGANRHEWALPIEVHHAH
jgi:hypothetical protein